MVMAMEKEYPVNEDMLSVVNEPNDFIHFFSSQEEAELYNLKKSLEKTDMERLQTLCRMIRIGKMLSEAKTSG